MQFKSSESQTASDPEFNTKKYWENRLTKDFSLAGVGFRRKGPAFNYWVYKIRVEKLEEAIRKFKIEAAGRDILDIGTGTGFFIDFWKQKNPSTITGYDLTEISIKSLKDRYPEANFELVDISDEKIRTEKKYDIISIFDVLYHIVEDKKFEQALKNLAKLSKPGTILIITDLFGKSRVRIMEHTNFRSYNEYQKLLNQNRFEIQGRLPLFYFLHPPLRINHRVLRFLGWMGWEILTIFAVWNWIGNLEGRWFYHLDRFLARIYQNSPSSQLLIVRFKG